MIVEDEPLVAMDLESILTAEGCNVVGIAGTVDKARALIAQARCDAALVDVNLAGHPVDELATALTQRNIPFAFVTGYARQAAPGGFQNAPLLNKPFSQDQLLAVLESLFHQHRRCRTAAAERSLRQKVPVGESSGPRRRGRMSLIGAQVSSVPPSVGHEQGAVSGPLFMRCAVIFKTANRRHRFRCDRWQANELAVHDGSLDLGTLLHLVDSTGKSPIVQTLCEKSCKDGSGGSPASSGRRSSGSCKKKEATNASFFRIDHVLAVDDCLAVHTPIMIPTAVPSTTAVVVATNNHRSAFAVNSPKPAIMVAVADPYVDILCERRDCNTKSHNRRNNKKTASHCTISSSMSL
jgi:CheY-like chemotaxis protein